MYGFFFILSYSAARYRDSFSNVFYMYLFYNCKNYLKVFYDIIYDGVGTVFYIKSRRLGNDFDFFFSFHLAMHTCLTRIRDRIFMPVRARYNKVHLLGHMVYYMPRERWSLII